MTKAARATGMTVPAKTGGVIPIDTLDTDALFSTLRLS